MFRWGKMWLNRYVQLIKQWALEQFMRDVKNTSQSHINRWSVCQKSVQRRYNWNRKKMFFLAFVLLAKELKKVAILCGQCNRESVSYQGVGWTYGESRQNEQ